MKQETITVIIKRPGEKVGHVEEIENSLKAMQGIVGGYIERFRLFENVYIICNEEGKIYDLPYNFTMRNEDFHGTVFVVGFETDRDGEQCEADCPISLRVWKEWLGYGI